MNTLADRLKSALEAKNRDTPGGVTQADLARACDLAASSVADWFSGETKTLKSESLLKAAAFLGVEPMWLLNGKGPRYPNSNDGPLRLSVAEPEPPPYQSDWPFADVTPEQWRNVLTDADRREVIGFVRGFLRARTEALPHKSRRASGAR